MKTIAPLSKSQYGIYAECVGHMGEVCYNLPYLYVLDIDLDGEQLCRAVETAVKAHPTLFTRIELNDDGEPMQTIDLDKETWALAIEDIDNIEQKKTELVQPFNIYGDRLFHIRLLRDECHYYLFIDYHHIIVDGTSMSIMLGDIDKAYHNEAIEPEVITQADIANNEVTQRQSDSFAQAKQWYASQFDCGDTFTQLIPDLEDPVHREASLLRTLHVDMARVDAFCKEKGIFRSTLFTSAYAFLLAKFNNEQEALFCTVYNGRTKSEMAHSLGMFVKTFPVYAKFTPDTTVIDFLQAGQEQMKGCRQHDIYSFSDMMEDLKLQTNSMFAWHGMLFS